MARQTRHADGLGRKAGPMPRSAFAQTHTMARLPCTGLRVIHPERPLERTVWASLIGSLSCWVGVCGHSTRSHEGHEGHEEQQGFVGVHPTITAFLRVLRVPS